MFSYYYYYHNHLSYHWHPLSTVFTSCSHHVHCMSMSARETTTFYIRSYPKPLMVIHLNLLITVVTYHLNLLITVITYHLNLLITCTKADLKNREFEMGFQSDIPVLLSWIFHDVWIKKIVVVMASDWLCISKLSLGVRYLWWWLGPQIGYASHSWVWG